MALGPVEPAAGDYNARSTDAVKSVIIEIAQTLGSFQGKFAIVGGAVPWLLLNNEEMPHVGTLDVDLGLDHEALGDGEYATLVGALQEQGYAQSGELRRFQLERVVDPGDGGPPIRVVVDFLMPRDAVPEKNDPPLLDDFAVMKASGGDLPLLFNELVEMKGVMPDGINNRVEIAVCSIPALLAMKGYALLGRKKQKDAYDVYYCIRNYPGGPEALAEACLPLLTHKSAQEGYAGIARKFETFDAYGPGCVRAFAEEAEILGERSADEWQQDAFGQVQAWLEALERLSASRDEPPTAA
ncbi:nucleotidyl transferase AbiEii/AbiGii toxin family protein [Sphingobium sp. CAP-1]|uniref:nucleotidyl transferase AbiEii/AbiGii toxin family protein n=1 Tax=Sphingobium sp. CAP-1 TaxID=2676077 RepID=UPI0012BB4871|nr:nucleotidyl transferase AbiEii/AbiGii toxin family protein [Sphingobium sp. CAP-1]QGP79369.1 hypothetical protein GL174_10530 [Sphingobium sp. CAP-1]